MATRMCISGNLTGLVCIAIYLLVSMYCVKGSGVLSTVSSHPKSSKEITCTDVRYAYTSKGFSNSDVPFHAISGEQLRICDRGLTCCTTDMEHKLSTHSRAEFDRLLRDTIGQVRATFAAQAQRFDEYFKELLRTSKKDFHEMFLRTYGMLYDRNSFIFKDMFDDLEKYYLTGGVDLTAALDNFFDRLYRKMFQVLNSQYTFNEMYMNCISQKMEELKPFGDVPKKLTVEVKRSFVATRTFVQALAIGRDVVKFVQEVGPTPECSRALMKMTYCPHCNGLPDLRPCSNYCLNVMRGCLAYHAELHQEWNNYINAMMMLASRLESSFNIESVVDPIDIKISDAIMNFQENGQVVSQELFKHCGKPRLGKRDARHELNFETLKFGHRENAVRPTTAAGTSIDRLVQGIRKKIKKTKNFWIQLSKLMCSNPQVAGQSKSLPVDDCWNGLDKAKYIADLMGEGLQNQTRNPEVHFDVSRQNSVINQQILTLKLITTKLTHAYNGLDVEWQDSDWSDSSGSGSGSGFGEDEPTEDSFGDIYFSTPSNPTRFIPDNRTPPKVSSATTRWQHSTLLICATFLIWSFIQKQIALFIC
ncbi:glypican-6-like [Argiope bruennichi]|uniref:glypican-6-like n=1 Tax=Argiope bruennichi TaxID=94029 RepID=UPI002494C992|nr:glypican-6-like [Argiope bruennichi]